MATEYWNLWDLPHNSFETFSSGKTKSLEQDWIHLFASNRMGARISGFRGYKWEVFSAELYPSVEGEEAKKLYFEQKAADFIILPNNTGLEQAVMIDQLPDLTDICEDYCVFPPNLAWTMAFTHEDGWFGPYFAKHKNYDDLVGENIRLVKKRKDMAYAKKKGWM